MTEAKTAPRGLYAVGAAGLGIEALVVLLAVPAVVSSQRGHVSGADVGYLCGLVVLLIVAAARLRHRGGKVISSAVQVLVIAAGAISWPMYVVGAAFAGIWIYWLRQFHLPQSG
jgi:peptidoglycan/LPS O-acetylase OafA/YrhL